MSSKIHEFAIERGRIQVHKKKEEVTLSSVHAKLWDLLIDKNKDLTKPEWTLVFNIVAPWISERLVSVHPAEAQIIIKNYLEHIGPEAEELSYFNALSDVNSKITYILRERFEMLLRVAKDTGSVETALQMSGLMEVKLFLNKTPKYLVSAAFESLLLFRKKGTEDEL